MAIKFSTTDNPRDFLPQARREIGAERKDHPVIFKQYMEVLTTNELQIEMENDGGMPDFPIRDEGDYMNKAKPDRGNTFRVQPEMRQLALVVTERDRHFNKTNKIERALRKMSRAGRRTQERIAATPLNLAFSSTRPTIDGQPYLSLTHVRVNGTIVANKPATPVDLTQSSLEAALVQFGLMKDEDGTYINVRPRYLVVHPNELPNAMRTVGAENIFVGGAGNVPAGADTGVANTYIKGFGLIVISNPYLTDPDAWFLLGEKDDNGLIYVENQKLSDKPVFQDPWTDDWVYSMSFMADAYASHGNSVYGSEGA